MIYANFKKTARLRAKIKRIKLKYQDVGWRECAKVYEDRIERINQKHETQINDTRREEEDKQAQRVDDLVRQVEDYRVAQLKNQDILDENLRKESFLREWEIGADRTVKGLELDMGKIISRVNELVTPISGRTFKLAKERTKEIKELESKIDEREAE